MGEAVCAGEMRAVARELELARLGTLVARKTTLWEPGIEIARAEGLRVLDARASDAEIALS